MTLVVREGVGITLGGVALGLPAAWAAGRLVDALLFDMSASDVRVLAAAAALFLLVTLAATVAPARRAARVDPMEAMRAD